MGSGYRDLILVPDAAVRWRGRGIRYVDDADAHHARITAAGYPPDTASANAHLARTLLPHNRPGRPRNQLRAPDWLDFAIPLQL